MWVGLDEVDWAALKHNYGSAEDVPDLLRRCAGPDPDDAEGAACDVLNLLFHQGGWVCSAASAALPFLLRLASAAEVTCRRTVMELVARLASEAQQVRVQFLDPGWRPAWERALPEVLVLLEDPEPWIRRDAADVVGVCGSSGELTLPSLLRRWQAEDDPATRLDVILALGQAVLRQPAGVHAAEVFDLLHRLLNAPEAQVRLAAIHALAPNTPDLAEQRLELLLEAVRDPSVELWRHTTAMDSGAQGVQHRTAALFPGPYTGFALGLLRDHPAEEQRTGALVQAAGLLAQWRSPTSALLPRIAARLNDPACEARFRAAELLACLGPAAAAHADEVAALLGDNAARTTRKRQTVGEAALWALARMNDPRCLPGLIELVAAGTRSGFTSTSASYPATAGWHHAVLPSLPEVLGYLADHVERLLPAICDQLGTSTDQQVINRLCQVLAGWGPSAKAAVPKLLSLMEDNRNWDSAALALAGIGPAGNGAQELLLTRADARETHTELAAWAHWKVSGEPGPLLEVIERAAAQGSIPRPALRKLADLGPHAARFADRLRAMTTDTDPWSRVEAARALWAATGDTETAVPALMTTVQGLAKGDYLPVMLPAVRHLAQIGHAARPAAQLLHAVPRHDPRLRSSGGWRGFTQDEDIRTAVDELLALCG
ncbi:HEAT repeat domain-containing protein [Streptomyces katrae]|uniref:HEAT repeat domain-containing protein n=1 Tax=Streptomyces katrae TaxID=68223 RepID=A0ABT7H5Z5_9ACTN|nr:HEAT repeat domain-containing protein [Streptomyces katrae]MDK9501303.1 HEAT repeat domain-containing protein [Streptomyces katrae]